MAAKIIRRFQMLRSVKCMNNKPRAAKEMSDFMPLHGEPTTRVVFERLILKPSWRYGMPIKSMNFSPTEVANDLEGKPAILMKLLGMGNINRRKHKGKAICFVISLPKR